MAERGLCDEDEKVHLEKGQGDGRKQGPAREEVLERGQGMVEEEDRRRIKRDHERSGDEADGVEKIQELP